MAINRAIVRHEVSYEKVPDAYQTYNWMSAEVHKITAECGHISIRRGGTPPKKYVRCRACEAGMPPKPIPAGPSGVIDKRNREIDDTKAKAILGRMTDVEDDWQRASEARQKGSV